MGFRNVNVRCKIAWTGLGQSRGYSSLYALVIGVAISGIRDECDVT